MTVWELLEYVAVACNVAYVLLASRGKAWCWPVGIVASVLSVFLFYHTRLYAETGLFVFYIFMGFYGWWQWNAHRHSGDLEIIEWPLKRHFSYVLAAWILTVVLAILLARYSDAAQPYLDAYTTVFAVLATWLTARRVLVNWLYWIAVNFLGIYLYASRGLDIYAWLALFFTGMSVYGFFAWRRKMQVALKL